MKNKKNENILVTVDLSKYSFTVVQQARILSEAFKIPMTFIYIFQDSEVLTSRFNVYKSQVIKYYNKLIQHQYDITDETLLLIKFNRTYQQIIAAAKKFPNPLIIAGHKGQSRLSQFFLGSTAEKLALESPYPVWIHRGDAAIFPKNILIMFKLFFSSDNPIM